MNLRLHHFLSHSRANGPGVRAVIWVQGCSLGCPGCFNPETHAPNGGEVMDVDALFRRIDALGDSIEGITISGGEPLQQRPAVAELLRRVKSETTLSVILFTGFTWDEIIRMTELPSREAVESERTRIVGWKFKTGIQIAKYTKDTKEEGVAVSQTIPQLLNGVDVLIAGRYDTQRRIAHALRGSSNKTVHRLTGLYSEAELESVPDAELWITQSGDLVLSGIEPVRW